MSAPVQTVLHAREATATRRAELYVRADVAEEVEARVLQHFMLHAPAGARPPKVIPVRTAPANRVERRRMRAGARKKINAGG